jgi:hypothetical protein
MIIKEVQREGALVKVTEITIRLNQERACCCCKKEKDLADIGLGIH